MADKAPSETKELIEDFVARYGERLRPFMRLGSLKAGEGTKSAIDYTTHGLTEQDGAFLAEILRREMELYEIGDGSLGHLPLHAVIAAGGIKAAECLPGLIQILHDAEPDCLITTCTVDALGEYGEAVLGRLEAMIQEGAGTVEVDRTDEEGEDFPWGPSLACDALSAVTVRYPHLGGERHRILLEALRHHRTQNYNLNGLIIFGLLDYADPESVPLIEDAFRSNGVDQFAVMWSDVVAVFPHLEPYPEWLPPYPGEVRDYVERAARGELFNTPGEDLPLRSLLHENEYEGGGWGGGAEANKRKKDARKEKNRKKQAKKSRKANRKRR